MTFAFTASLLINAPTLCNTASANTTSIASSVNDVLPNRPLRFAKAGPVAACKAVPVNKNFANRSTLLKMSSESSPPIVAALKI